MEQAIKIEGLAQFSRHLRKLDSELPKALRVAMNEAADLVVTDSRALVPKRSGKAAASIKAASTRTAVRVKAGGKRVPYYAFLDFGGRVGRRKATRRPFIKEGRYLYPTYFKLRDTGRIQQVLEKSLLDVARQSGVEVT